MSEYEPLPRCERCGHRLSATRFPVMGAVWRQVDGLLRTAYHTGCGCECVPDERLDEWRAKAGA